MKKYFSLAVIEELDFYMSACLSAENHALAQEETYEILEPILRSAGYLPGDVVDVKLLVTRAAAWNPRYWLGRLQARSLHKNADATIEGQW